MKSYRMTVKCGGLLLVCLLTNTVRLRAEEFTGATNFVRNVLPTLQMKCFSCHGDDPNDVRGELNALTRDGLIKGGESGEPAIVSGKPDESLLYLAATRTSDLVGAMPPKENDALNEKQLAALKSWIENGAIWPSEKEIAAIRKEYQSSWDAAENVSVETSGGLAEEWTNRRYKAENLWAYQPLWSDSVGWLKESKSSPIDTLIQRRLDELKISPAPRADRLTLVRRATYDLIGLPPTQQEIKAFLDDPADESTALETVIERLLVSPHYGEQWGRHWLDVVRYADSSGFANDYERGNAWRYRDYVVRAFNNDKPYNEFILEQIAGDELDSSNPENLIAVGFLRMGAWELTGMEVAKIARQRYLDDVTDIVGQTFLGHMLQCARCHDHKFDPVPTRDYYSIQAVFATTQLAERRVEFLKEENTSGFEEQKYLQQRQKHYNALLAELAKKQTVQAAREWYELEQKEARPFEETLRTLAQKKGGEENVSLNEIRSAMQKTEINPELIPPRHVGFIPQDFGVERVARKGLERLRWRNERYAPYALSVYNGKSINHKSINSPSRMPADPRSTGELEQTFILTGGDPFSPSLPVFPGVLSAVRTPPMPTMKSTDKPEQSSFDRRLDLARWIASKDNPLTARVIVNRLWQWHFNQAIAGNPNNFGTTGKQPTHPELLDYLAHRLLDQGWSLKAMHREIMLSDAYCRSTRHPNPDKLDQADPLRDSDAVFLPRRLDAEELRDSMLAVSGELNPTVGGIPIRPEMNLAAALQPRQVMGTFAEAWQPSPRPEQRHRRSIYALQIRGQRDPFSDVFNAPGADLSCERREASTVTPQVFALFNNEQTYFRGVALANRLLTKNAAMNKSAVMTMLFRKILGRNPTSTELTACLEHWDKMERRHTNLQIPAWQPPLEVIREAVEENTGEKFTFQEPLEFYADFIPDLHPSAVDARTRGLAEVCLVLLNSNEFAYVY